MKITDENWQVSARSKGEKQEMLAYAKDSGVRVAQKFYGMMEDEDLFVGNFGGTVGLGSLPNRHPDERQTTLISSFDFFKMCDEFVHARQTA